MKLEVTSHHKMLIETVPQNCRQTTKMLV